MESIKIERKLFQEIEDCLVIDDSLNNVSINKLTLFYEAAVGSARVEADYLNEYGSLYAGYIAFCSIWNFPEWIQEILEEYPQLAIYCED